MCNLYSITTNQAAIAALFRVVNRYVNNLAPMPGVLPSSSANVTATNATEETKMRSISYASSKEAPPKTRKPPEGQSPEATCIVKIGYIRQSNDGHSRNLAT
jgi:hypothetical protein